MSTLIEPFDERHPGWVSGSQLRTLQWRIRDYRALHGPVKEADFQQEHPPKTAARRRVRPSRPTGPAVFVPGAAVRGGPATWWGHLSRGEQCGDGVSSSYAEGRALAEADVAIGALGTRARDARRAHRVGKAAAGMLANEAHAPFTA